MKLMRYALCAALAACALTAAIQRAPAVSNAHAVKTVETAGVRDVQRQIRKLIRVRAPIRSDVPWRGRGRV